MIRAFFLAAALAAGPVSAQDVTDGTGAALRVLDKVTASVTDVVLTRGEVQSFGLLKITLQACRYPTSNPNGDAFAGLRITYRDDPTPVFSGWMIASAPALHALDHPRYDVWVLRCETS